MKVSLRIAPLLVVSWACCLSGCVTPGVSRPTVPGTGVGISSDRTGFKLSQAKHDYFVRSGVPAEWMTPYPDKDYPWFLSQQNEDYVYRILQKDRNP